MKTHLTIEERNTILTGVRQGCDKTTIAKMVGKDKFNHFIRNQKTQEMHLCNLTSKRV